MTDIFETRTPYGIMFTAITEEAKTWMRDKFAGKVEVTYRLQEGTMDFRRRARLANLTISLVKRSQIPFSR